MTKDEILAEIRRTALENGGRPLGRGRFMQATGISDHEIGRYWARFGDAQREAGFDPNTLNMAIEEDVLMERLADLIRELGKVPTVREMRLRRHRDPTFPNHKVFERYGTKTDLVGAVLTFFRDRPGYADVVEICKPIYSTRAPGDSTRDVGTPGATYGFVYMARGHRGEYKIGRTTLVDRRVSELGATGPVALTLVHEIKTDDPVGVEAYWHRRFEQKRMRGEWFSLTASDVAAFKRWKRIA